MHVYDQVSPDEASPLVLPYPVLKLCKRLQQSAKFL